MASNPPAQPPVPPMPSTTPSSTGASGTPPTIVAYNTSHDVQKSNEQQVEDFNVSNKQKLALQAQNTREARQKAAAEKQAADAAEQARIAAQERLDEQHAEAFQQASRASGESIKPFTNWLASQPTPGGMATIVILLVFFWMAILPVNTAGDTRLYLLWLTITGKTHLRYQEGGGASANFGKAGPTSDQNVKSTYQNGTSDMSNLVIDTGLSANVPSLDNLDVWSILGFGDQ